MNKLYVTLLGGKPADSTIEAHNVFFGIGPSLESLFPSMKKFWPSAPKIHIDAYMCVDRIGQWNVFVAPKEKELPSGMRADQKLFFLNLGGYRKGELEEFHKKIIIVADSEASAVELAKRDPFFKEGLSEGKALAHIDDKKTLDEFEAETPIDVGELVNNQGYRLGLKQIEGYFPGMPFTYPQVTVTGFLRIP